MTGSDDRASIPAEFRRLGYTLLCRLGEGATSEVFEARHDESNRRVALKVSRLDIPEAPAVVLRMQTEWNVGRGLRHPHLVTILDGGTLPDGRAWLIMELLQGHDLESELDEVGVIEPRRAVHMMRQVCEALLVIHRRGAVHRDVKPENMFLCSDGRFADHVKLIDLGILALPEDDPARVHEPTGAFILGTPLYLAPEQARGLSPDPRTDLYAVGGVLYRLVSGRPPFWGQDPTEIVARHITMAVEPLDQLVPDLPPELVQFVHQCLEKDRDRRPPDAAAAIEALDGCARALAGGFAPVPSLRSAQVPEVPAAGHAGEWTRFAELMDQVVTTYWTGQPPPEVATAMQALDEARTAWQSAREQADALRERADLQARYRIETQARLDQKSRRIRTALNRATQRRKECERLADDLAAAVDAADARYEREVEALGRLTGRAVDDCDVTRLGERFALVEHVLRERGHLLDQLTDARNKEMAAAERMAVIRTDEIELQREFADQELVEQDDGFHDEHAAAQRADEALASHRAFEAAALRLLLAYVRAASK
jgi:serine/threonine-protein kinase